MDSQRSDGSYGSARVRRSPDDGSRRGTIIAAFVRARLLGFKILTLDARVVHVPAGAGENTLQVSGSTSLDVSRGNSESSPRPRRERPANADLAYALRLLEEGSRNLDELERSE